MWPYFNVFLCFENHSFVSGTRTCFVALITIMLTLFLDLDPKDIDKSRQTLSLLGKCSSYFGAGLSGLSVLLGAACAVVMTNCAGHAIGGILPWVSAPVPSLISFCSSSSSSSCHDGTQRIVECWAPAEHTAGNCMSSYVLWMTCKRDEVEVSVQAGRENRNDCFTSKQTMCIPRSVCAAITPGLGALHTLLTPGLRRSLSSLLQIYFHNNGTHWCASNPGKFY